MEGDTAVPIPWGDLNPRAPQRDVGEKAVRLSLADRVCFHCYIPDCVTTESPECPLVVLGWVHEGGMVKSGKSIKERV